MDIKNIIFDLGGVLLDWNPRHLYKNYFQNNWEVEFFLATVCTSQWNEALDKGASFDENIETLVKKFPEYAYPIRIYKDKWINMVKDEIQESVSIMYKLKDKGYGIYALSNWSAETFPLVENKFSFLKDMDGIVISGAEKVAKPDLQIFRILLERYSLNPQESLLIDDNISNINAAKELGIAGIRFTSPSKLKNQLRKREIL